MKDLLEKLRARKAKYKDAEEDVTIQKKLQAKQMSSNERELNKYLEEERERKIAEMVKQYRKKKQDEYNYGNQGWKDKRNIFKGQPSILRNEKHTKGSLLMR